MPKLNGIDYPDSFHDVMKDKDLKPFLLKEVTKNRDQPIAAHAMQGSNFNPIKYYETFFASNAKYPLQNFVGKIQGAADRLAENKDWDKIGAWKKVYKAAQDQSTLQLDGVDVKGLYERSDFLAYHRKRLGNEIKLSPAMMKNLGISDQKGAAKVLAAIQVGQTADAEKLAGNLIKKEKIKQAPRDFVKAMLKMVKM